MHYILALPATLSRISCIDDGWMYMLYLILRVNLLILKYNKKKVQSRPFQHMHYRLFDTKQCVNVSPQGQTVVSHLVAQLLILNLQTAPGLSLHSNLPVQPACLSLSPSLYPSLSPSGFVLGRSGCVLWLWASRRLLYISLIKPETHESPLPRPSIARKVCITHFMSRISGAVQQAGMSLLFREWST